MPAQPRRVLVILHGAVGDVTRALPLLCRLRRGLPDARLFWAVEPICEPLLRHHPALDDVVVFERQRGFGAFPRFIGQVRRLRPDCALDLQRHIKSGFVSLASGASRRLGFHRRNSREGNFLFHTEHLEPMPHLSSKLQQFLRFADHLGVPPAPVEFGLALLPQEEREVDALLEGAPLEFAVFPVGSTAETRLWFPAETARVIDALAARGIGAVLAGAPGEERWAAAIEAECRAPVCNLTARTTLRQLVGVVARARLVIAPDSGPMHIAAAVGTRVVSLWGATSSERSAPWGSQDLVVEGRAPCRPCYRKTCPIGRECMRNISVDMVMEKVERGLARAGGP